MTTMIAALVLAGLAGPQDLPPAMKRKIEYARADVEKSPDSPKANLELGKLLCFTVGDWAEGLPYLSKGGDKDYAPLAGKDLAGGNALERVEVADQWLALSKKQKAAKDRALVVYGEAWPQLTDDVWRGKVRERLLQLQAKAMESRTLGPAPASWGPISGAGLDRQFARTGASSLKFPPLDPAKKNAGAYFSSEQMPCAAGATIKFSFWVLSNGSESFDELRIKCRNAKQGAAEHLLLLPVKTPVDVPIWTKVEGEATAPDGTASVEISFKRGGAGAGTVFVDDVSLTVNGRELLKNGGFER